VGKTNGARLVGPHAASKGNERGGGNVVAVQTGYKTADGLEIIIAFKLYRLFLFF
jgi:hypothetical protein